MFRNAGMAQSRKQAIPEFNVRHQGALVAEGSRGLQG